MKFMMQVSAFVNHQFTIAAGTIEEARELSKEAVRRMFPKDTPIDFGFPDGQPAPDSATAISQVCLLCGAAAMKADFGPGHLTCPTCKKMQPSAAQQQAMDADDSRFPGRS